MSQLLYKTIANERPQGKPKVYFTSHPDDFDHYFNTVSQMILSLQDCAIWYASDKAENSTSADGSASAGAPSDASASSSAPAAADDLSLSQMQLFVVPITSKLLTTPNRAMDFEIPLALKQHIPVLPLMMEQGLDTPFQERFGDLQYLDPNNTDPTKRRFEEVLQAYLKSTLVSTEIADKVRAAFDAYIFLSYRKKDRRKAAELMRLIHANPLCRDIAIWYDEFLTPGEDFNEAIGAVLEKSDLFALAVTPNLVNEVNYVMTTEYPAALAQHKPILPVEMEPTDRADLAKHYEALPPVASAKDDEAFNQALLEKLKAIAITENDNSPAHNYLIGLAYLDGIDVEVNRERALELITGAAKAGLPEAMDTLVTMYETGKGVERNYRTGVEWRVKHVNQLVEIFKAKHTHRNAFALLEGYQKLGDAEQALRYLDNAKEAYERMKALSELLCEKGDKDYKQWLSLSFSRLGNIAEQQGELREAYKNYNQALAITERLACEPERAERAGTRRNLMVDYEKMADIAMKLGRLSQAQEFYDRSLTIAETLAEETNSIRSRFDLAAIYNTLGGFAEVKQDVASAAAYYGKSLPIYQSLAGETNESAYKTDLAGTYSHLGDIAKAKEDYAAAESYYLKSLSLFMETDEEDGTITSRRNLAVIYNKLGENACLRGRDEYPKAEEYYEKSFAISEALEKRTHTLESRRDLFASLMNFGDINMLKLDFETAKLYYKKGLDFSTELAKEISSPKSFLDVSVCYNRLGFIAELTGDLPYAKACYEKSAEIRQLVIEETDLPSAKEDLQHVKERIAELEKKIPH